ncbi:hypothetical protein [Streptomyces sp. CS159]|uniref:hypothetical protein n=1 Tax=Streptomyces sp. CS159 TaxID=1982762 RepID=UPI00211B0198|nr:hypothetical protein [Streptomyces sp. CS159]
MPDLLWDDVKCFFHPDLMGSLPDVGVPGASVEDWQAVLDLVAEKGWKRQYSEGGTELPVPRAEAVLSRPADAECLDLRVWPTPDVLAIFRFHVADEVDFDVDLRVALFTRLDSASTSVREAVGGCGPAGMFTSFDSTRVLLGRSSSTRTR